MAEINVESIGFDALSKSGKPRFCVGRQVQHFQPSDELDVWGGISNSGVKVPMEEITLCSVCATAGIPEDKRYRLTKEFWWTCSVYTLKACRRYGFDVRCMILDGLRVGVNAVSGDDWRAFPKLADPIKEAAGILTIIGKTCTNYEISIGPASFGRYANTSNMYFKVAQAFTGTGANRRDILVTSRAGSTDFYSPLCDDAAPLIVNSYKKEELFFFQAPSPRDIVAGFIPASHYDDLNKIFFVLDIYRKEPPPPTKRVREWLKPSPGKVEDIWPKGFEMARACAQGCGAAASSFGTARAANTFTRVGKQVKISIQIITDESPEELEYCSALMQAQIDSNASMAERRKQAVADIKSQEDMMLAFV